MNELSVFNYNKSNIRTVTINGEPWFVLKDVCDILRIGNTTDTANRLDDDEKATFDSIEGLRKDTVFISEARMEMSTHITFPFGNTSIRI
ncbi:hypothetical protein AGMMS49975_09650 [Clostridia bacterium]|nr:hypothetical protein AGMMS49975_09650 [Clostridia bacterium]